MESSSVTGLAKDDYLKLLVGQLRNQNPLNPAGDQDFIAQLTRFSTLEQVTNLAAAGERMSADMDATRAVGLIGRTVTYVGADGTAASGVVEQVSFSQAGASLTIGGVSGIDPATVTEVA